MIDQPETPKPPSALHLVETNAPVHISNAYKGIPTSDLRRLTCFVSHTDYRDVFDDHLTMRGMHTTICGSLFYAFAREFRLAMAQNPAANPAVVAVRMLDSIKFDPDMKGATHHE